MTVGCFSLHLKFIHYSEINVIILTDNHSFAGIFIKKRGGDLKINEFYIALTELFLSKTLNLEKMKKELFRLLAITFVFCFVISILPLIASDPNESEEGTEVPCPKPGYMDYHYANGWGCFWCVEDPNKCCCQY